MVKSSWESFKNIRSQSFEGDLTVSALKVSPDDLVLMRDYRLQERTDACGGYDPIAINLAYAQDELAYDESGDLYTPEPAIYKTLSRDQKLNKFGLAYRRDAEFYLNKILADIVVGAAIGLYNAEGWSMVLYDGLRTMEGAYNLYRLAPDSDIEMGLLALPGQSAHNKGLAVDSMVVNRHGVEVPMGGHFDHLDMETNSRAYAGDKLSDDIQTNRLVREAMFLRSAFSQNLLVAPLRSEFWDDRPPENRADLWRVLDSAARCVGKTLITPDDLALRKKDRAAFSKKWESWSYADFLTQWEKTFKESEDEIEELLGSRLPPSEERIEFYHGNYHPIYDSDLIASGKNLTQA